jgi:hypothetical protein
MNAGVAGTIITAGVAVGSVGGMDAFAGSVSVEEAAVVVGFGAKALLAVANGVIVDGVPMVPVVATIVGVRRGTDRGRGSAQPHMANDINSIMIQRRTVLVSSTLS